MTRWGRRKKALLLVGGSASVTALLLSLTVLPLVDNKTWLQSILSDEYQPIVTMDGPAYNYWYAPENSFGVSSFKEVNWSYFKALFLAHTEWMMEYKRYSYSEWTVAPYGQNWGFNRTWNESGFWKVDLWIDTPVDLFEARFTMGIDLPVLQYVERSGPEVWINYSANATEIYSVYFNWSDIASIPGLYFNKGVSNDLFWFRFGRFNIPAGQYEFDPWFGNQGGYTSYLDLEHYYRGGFHAPASDGTADNITVYLMPYTAYDNNVRCYIYEYVDYTSNYAGDLIATTEILDVSSGSGWYTFDFSDPKPSVSNGVNYYLMVWGDDQNPGDIYVGRSAFSGGTNCIYKSDSSPGDDPLTGETAFDDKVMIYCSYTEGGGPAESWQVINSSFNGTVFNQSQWQTFNNSFNGSVFNQSSWSIFNNTFNGTVYNGSAWGVFNNSFNGTVFNSSSWIVIDTTFNGTVYNSTDEWVVLNTTFNGTVFNNSQWQIFNNSFNGTVFNQSLGWRDINSSFNGTVFNSSSWGTFNNSINGTVYNGSSWSAFNTTFNGTVFNSTDLWYILNTTFNGTVYNSSSWETFNTSFNGTVYNSTDEWVILSSSFNGTVYNGSGWSVLNTIFNGTVYNGTGMGSSITISNPFPSNNSYFQGVQPTLYFTLSHEQGLNMNYSIFYGNSSANTTVLFENISLVGNGTYHYVNYFTATDYGTSMWWRVQADAAGSFVNESYLFTPTRAGMQTIQSNALWVIPLMFSVLIPFVGFIVFRRRKG